MPTPWGSGTSADPWKDPNVGGGGSPGGGGYYNPPPFQSTTGHDPNMDWWIDKAKGFMDTSTLGAQKQNAANDINTSAGAQSAAFQNMMARRGISDSGIAMSNQAKVMGQAERDKNRAFQNLDIADKDRRDRMLLGSQGGFAEPGRLQAQMANNQFQNWMGMNQMYGQQQNNAFQQMMAMMQMYGQYGGGQGQQSNKGWSPLG